MTGDRDTLTPEEREQIDLACIADWKRGWSGIHPDRHNINTTVESIVAARVRAAQAQAWAEGRAAGFMKRPAAANPYRSDPGDEFQDPED